MKAAGSRFSPVPNPFHPFRFLPGFVGFLGENQSESENFESGLLASKFAMRTERR